jgi:Lar family restriction alleviation protein
MSVAKRRRRTMETELKPCPFCGEDGTIIIRKGKNGWRDRYAVLCDYEHGGCGSESGWYHYEAEAIEAWNRRADDVDGY